MVIDKPLQPRITSIAFTNFKAFKTFSVSLGPFNVLVGPNNSGKSTIIVAMRMLAEAFRKANAKSAEMVEVDRRTTWGYRISLAGLPVASENVFHNYDDSTPASITFRVSGGKSLELVFPEQGTCLLICHSGGPQIRTPSDFRRHFPIKIGFVPILGPVEPDEPLYQEDAARLALLTHRASRNFRNIWHHFAEDFPTFKNLVRQTWPGMDIEPPEVQMNDRKAALRMFCPEERFPREIYWAGYGFQVWCQMLTFIVKSRDANVLVIDEPDIYLHSDLQRQLVALLRSLGPDIVMATHSTEIISEAEPGELMSINKKWRSAKSIKDTTQIQQLFAALGSGINPALTLLSKTKRALFVEGGDFQLISAFARKVGNDSIANRSDFAVLPVDGFNPKRVADVSRGIELTLGAKIRKGTIFDRDYRSDSEVKTIITELLKTCDFVFIHDQKEIENHLLVPKAIEAAIDARLRERALREGTSKARSETGSALLEMVTNKMKSDVFGQYLAKRSEFEKRTNPGKDLGTINSEAMAEFETRWNDLESRMKLVPGKATIGALNVYLQTTYKIAITGLQVIQHMGTSQVTHGMRTLIGQIDGFRKQALPDID